MVGAATFERHRPRLLRLAQRMLGSRAEAEDVVQEASIRWFEQGAARGAADVEAPEAWLVTVVTRLAIDRLRSLRAERERYVGPWLPEPWVSGIADAPAPDASVVQKEELGYATLVLLDRLSPEERAAFLLHDVFAVGYPVIAAALERSEAACRQLVHRARESVRLPMGPRREAEAERAASPEARAEILRRLQAAMLATDEAALAALFTSDVVFTTDGGGKVFAAKRLLHGPDEVSRALVGVQRKSSTADGRWEIDVLEGEPVLVQRGGGKLFALLYVDVDPAAQVCRVFKLLNPDKLAAAALVLAR
jgi:RNA polymerase sigma-70 factor, ECF subfamily